MPGQKSIDLFDSDMTLVASFPSIHGAAKWLGVTELTVKKYALTSSRHPKSGLYIAYRDPSYTKSGYKAQATKLAAARATNAVKQARARANANKAAASAVLMMTSQKPRPSWMT